MANFCTHCGKPLNEGAKFCIACGSPVGPAAPGNSAKKTEPQHKEPTPEQEQPVQSTAKTPKTADSGKKQSIPGMLAAEMRELLKHPKKLIPTIVLAAVWIILPILMGFVSGANIPVIRLISTLTYANGGVFGGFFGTVGGIFGKAVFAACVNGLVLAVAAKKNPFKGMKKGLAGVFGGGVKAVSPFLLGGGVGFLLYFFFNITAAPQNSAIAVVCLITAMQAIAKQNGILFGLVFWAAKKVSKGKAPTRVSVNRVVSGLAAGFAVSFPMTFLRFPILIAVPGILLTVGGIVMPIVLASSGKKTAQEVK